MLISVDTLVALGVNPKHVLHIGAHMLEEMNDYERAGWHVTWVESQQHIVDSLNDHGHRVVNATIWNENTTVTFHETNNGQSSSCLPLELHSIYYPDIIVTRTYDVQTTTIDDLNVDVDMLNLDVQGAEMRALQGATRTLQNVKWIYTEISNEPLYAGSTLEPELNAWLMDHGFEQTLKIMTPHGWGDAFYVRTETHGH